MKLFIVLALFGCVFSHPQQQLAEVFPVYEEDVALEPQYDENPEFFGEEPNLANDEMPIEDPAAELIPVEDVASDPDYIPRTHVFIRPFYFKPFRPFYRQPSVFPWRRESPDSPVDAADVEPETERRPSLWDFLFRDFNGPPFISSRPRQPEEEAPVDEAPSEGGNRHGFHSFFNTFFNQPRLPDLPRVDHSDYPSNYSNSTYDVHDVNGSKFAVNTTITKHSGPGFHNFFHFRVVHHLPGEETPEGEIPQETPQDELPQEYPEEIPQEYPEEIPQEYPEEIPQETPESEIPTYYVPEEVPVVEDDLPPVELPTEQESTNEIPAVPEIYNELDNELPSEIMKENEIGEFMLRDDPRSANFLKFPSFKYKEKDLSSDTRVNRLIGNDKQQTMTAVDPDAEVFDLNLVLREHEGENE